MSATTELPRLIILHKQSTSARVRFMTLGDSVLAFSPLPETATLHDEDYSPAVRFHPSAAIRAAETVLELAEGELEAVPEFCIWLFRKLTTRWTSSSLTNAPCTRIGSPVPLAM